MFASQESTPWYRSLTARIALGAACLLILAASTVYVVRRKQAADANEAHYAALEQDRARQQNLAGAAAPQPEGNQANNAAASQASPAPGAPGSTPATTETASAHATRNYWTSFRGPNRDGRYDEMPVLTEWPAGGLTPVWKQPVGLGWSSFVVADGRAYTIEQRRGQEVAAAYDISTGRELWKQGWNAAYTDSTGDGPRATPTWDDGRIYALGATGELRCLDAKTGGVVWGKNILSDNGATNISWAMSASPLIVDDKVIVLPGGSGNKSVVAYNKLTGAPVWKSQNDTAAYVSPMLMTLAGRRQIVVVSASRAMGLVPENGSVLWSHTWDTDMGINVSQPIPVTSNRFFISAGYGKGAALVEVSGSGNSFSTKAVWENINMKNKFNSSVLHEGHVYGLDEGILTCLDVNTGARKWKGGRYGYGQVILASGHLIVSTDAGELVLVKASPNQFTEVARFSALEGKTWNYPAIAGGKLLVRNATQMAAYNIAAR